MLEGLRRQGDRMEEGIVMRLVQELDERGTLGGFSQNQMRDIMDNAIEGVRRDIRSLREGGGGGGGIGNGGGGGGEVRPRFNLHMWGGKLHRLPQHWQIPRGMNLKALFHLWYMGSVADGVPPFSTIINTKEFEHLKRGKTIYGDMKYLMKSATRAVVQQRQENLLEEDAYQWTADKVNRFYSAVVDRYRFCKHNRDMQGLSWMTIARNLYKRKGALLGENVQARAAD